MPDMPSLADIRLHPIKSLDGISVRQSRIGPAGGLELDRVWALSTTDGYVLNGKRTAAVNLIRAAFAPDISSVRLSAPARRGAPAPLEFGFPGDFTAAAQWFSGFFGEPVVVSYAPEGFPDDTDRNGPMVISTATLRTVTEWFHQISLGESRARFRAPLEIDGVEAFWEDRLYSEDEARPVRFSIGDVAFEGTNPCPRCVVPTRDTQTGIDTLGFQKRFTELRRTQFPAWASAPNRIRHFYHLGVNTRVAPTEHGKLLRVGDPVRQMRDASECG